MEQTTKTQLTTDTRAAVLLVTGMIGAFMVGMGFIMSISKSVSTIADQDTSPIATAQPLYATSVLAMQVSGNPPSEGVESPADIVVSGADANGTITTQFGAFTGATGSFEYVIGQASSTQRAVVVDFSTSTHPATILSLGVNNRQAATSVIPGIPTANAQVFIGPGTPVCIPEKKTATVSTLPATDGPRWLPTAQAQVNVNEATCSEGEVNGCYACSNNQWQYNSTLPGCSAAALTRYYVSSEGNVYTDQALLHRVNTVDCAAQIAKGYTPNDITNVTSNKTIDLGPGANLVMLKAWPNILGLFNSNDGYYDLDTDMLGHPAPLFIIGVNNTGAEMTVPEATLTVTSDEGAKNLCLPSKHLNDDEWFVAFYSADGKPYSDMTLTKALSCGTTNTCSTVNCTKYPKHACCTIVQPQEQSVQ